MQSRLLLTSLLGFLASTPTSLLAAPLPVTGSAYDTTGLLQQQQQQQEQQQVQASQGLNVQSLSQGQQAPVSSDYTTNPYVSASSLASSSASSPALASSPSLASTAATDEPLTQQATSGYTIPASQDAAVDPQASGSTMLAMAPAQNKQQDSASGNQGMSNTDKMSLGIGAAGLAATAVGAGATIHAVRKADQARKIMVDQHAEMKQILAPNSAGEKASSPRSSTETLYDNPPSSPHSPTSQTSSLRSWITKLFRA